MADPNQNQGQNQNKFAPPPSNNSIRTMEKDMTAFKLGGGQLPTLSQLPEENKPAPTPTFLNQNSAPSIPQFNVPPTPPVIPIPESAVSAPQPQQPIRPKSNSLQKYLIIAGPIAAIILIAGGWFLIRGTSGKPVSNYAAHPVISASPVTVSPSPSPSPTPTPSPFITLKIAPTKSEALLISYATSSALIQAIASRAAQTEQTQTMVELMPQDSNGILSSNQLLSLLAQNVPPALDTNLDPNYLLFLYYSQPTAPHLGAVFSIKSANILTIQSLFQSWETANIDSDLSAIFLGKNTGGRATPTFQSSTYKNVQTHYVVYKTPGLALNYAFLNDYLIIAANKDPLFAAIDHLLPPSQ